MSWSPFIVRLLASRLATSVKRDSNTGVFLGILQTLWTPISKNICERLLLIVVIDCIEKWIKLFRSLIGLLFLLKHKILYFTYSHSYSLLSFDVTYYLSLAVPLVCLFINDLIFFVISKFFYNNKIKIISTKLIIIF